MIKRNFILQPRKMRSFPEKNGKRLWEQNVTLIAVSAAGSGETELNGTVLSKADERCFSYHVSYTILIRSTNFANGSMITLFHR